MNDTVYDLERNEMRARCSTCGLEKQARAFSDRAPTVCRTCARQKRDVKARAVVCPMCSAAVGQWCTTRKGERLAGGYSHKARLRAWMRWMSTERP